MDDDWTPRPGDEVIIDIPLADGTFADFEGVIESINEESGKIRVRISFFGRDTRFELDRQQIRKLV